MNARTLIAVACVAVLSACAGGKFVVNERYFPSGVWFVPDERKVQVSIDDRDGVFPPVITVNQEPLKLNANPGTEVTVTFRLQNQGHQNYFFEAPLASDPLGWGELKGNPKFRNTSCSYGSDKTELICKFTVAERRQVNSYVLRVCPASGSCFKSDPSMMN
jgi:hypothetical protein